MESGIKSALCLSGRPYGLIECSENIRKNIIEPNNCDVFVHTWWNPDDVDKRYKNHPDFPGRVPYDCIQKIKDLYHPKSFIVQPQIQFPIDGFDSTYQPGNKNLILSVQSMFYSIQQSIKLAIDFIENTATDYSTLPQYDAICRCRFDLQFENPIIFSELDLNKLNIYDDCNHDCTCLNDHFAVANQDIMKLYAQTFPEIYKMYFYGVPWVPEIFLGKWMAFNGIEKSHIQNMKYRQFK